MTKIVEVAAAVILRDGEFLLAQRPAGKVYAGWWEFPGGKVEAGETMRDALVRELQEELGITVDLAWPWVCREFTYPHAKVRLKFFRVASWHGEIMPIEHSGFAWVKNGAAPSVEPILPANGPILKGLSLPPLYALTHAEAHGVDAELARLEAALAGGLRLIQVRDKRLMPAERERLARRAVALARPYGARVLINDDEALARTVAADGVHLSAARLRQVSARPAFDWVGASCHDEKELAHAAALELDFAVLGPVLPTPTHPDAAGLGWTDFASTIENSPLPVFALGGMQREMLETSWEHGAHGVALMRGW